jgi:hypothetical protein
MSTSFSPVVLIWIQSFDPWAGFLALYGSEVSMLRIIRDAIERAEPPRTNESHLELLAEGFGPDADFYLKGGEPYVVFPVWGYAEYWGPGDVCAVLLSGPVIRGTKISEAEFRTLVRDIHGLEC